jgi:1-deoxy-D-xylulose-5-phosphate synthase
LEKEKLFGALINARFIKPLDKSMFLDLAWKTEFIFTVEEGILDGGFGSEVSAIINRPVERMGLPCEFITHGKRDILLEKYGLDPKGIAERIKSVVRAK